MVNVPYSLCHLGSFEMTNIGVMKLMDLLIHHTEERQNKWQVVFHRQDKVDEHKDPERPFQSGLNGGRWIMRHGVNLALSCIYPLHVA
jgi:hypothetical protein